MRNGIVDTTCSRLSKIELAALASLSVLGLDFNSHLGAHTIRHPLGCLGEPSCSQWSPQWPPMHLACSGGRSHAHAFGNSDALVLVSDAERRNGLCAPNDPQTSRYSWHPAPSRSKGSRSRGRQRWMCSEEFQKGQAPRRAAALLEMMISSLIRASWAKPQCLG